MLIVIALGVHRRATWTLRCDFVALHNFSSTFDPQKNNLREHLPCLILREISWVSIMIMLLRVSTNESMKPRPYFQALIYRFSHFCYSLPCCNFYNRIILICFTTHITHILSSLHWTSAPIQLAIVLVVLGRQETSCILIAGPFRGILLNLCLPWVR